MVRFSIITINYNNCEGLKKTMQSVLGNSYNDYEFIIIDGGSSDGSTEYIQRFAHKLAYWVSEKDDGVYDAMNKGIQRVSGKYIMFLNSGDCLMNDQLLAGISKKIAGANGDIFYGNMLLEKEHNRVEAHHYPAYLTLDFWKQATINHQSSFIKTTLFKEVGLYNTDYQLAADYAFFLKCFFLGKHFQHIDEAWVRYNANGLSGQDKTLYKQQMDEAWYKTIPAYLIKILDENKAYKFLMNHRLVRWAAKLNKEYNRLRSPHKID